MMKKAMFGLLVLVVGAGCVPESSTTPPASQFVPAERAYQGAACETIGRTAGVCAREGDFCAQGGYRPASYECIFNTWRCTVDTTRSCPASSQRMECARGDYLGSCNFRLSCPDGSPVPAEYECIGGQRVCLPTGDCPRPQSDAGIVSDSNISDGSAPDSTPATTPVMSIRYDGPVSGPVYAGLQDVRLQRTTLRSERNVEVRDVRFRIETVGPTGQLSDASGNTFLRDVKLIDEGTGRVLMGPIDLRPAPNARTIDVRFTGSFPVNVGPEIRLALTADTSYRFDPSLTGTRFRVVADGGNGHFFAPAAVRSVDDGAYLAPEQITDNVVIPGNEYTVRRPTLSADLVSTSSMPRYTVKRALNVPSLFVRLTADPGSDLRITRMRLSGVGRINLRDPFLARDFSRVVTACTIRDGETMLGTSRVPDGFGHMEFTGLNFVITRGTSRVYSVVCTMDSVIEGDFGDAYALGFVDGFDFGVEDSVGTDPDITVDPLLTQQLSRPTVFVSVGNSGGITVTPEAAMSYEPTSVRYGTWYTGQSVRIEPNLEPVVIDRVRVRLIGNSRCVESINVARASDPDRMLAFAGVFPTSVTTTAADLEFPVPITVGLEGGSISLMIQWHTSVDPTIDPYGCHSGDVVSFGLDLGATAGEWDARYSSGYNMRITGTMSGERIYAAAPTSAIMNRFRLPAAP